MRRKDNNNKNKEKISKREKPNNMKKSQQKKILIEYEKININVQFLYSFIKVYVYSELEIG